MEEVNKFRQAKLLSKLSEKMVKVDDVVSVDAVSTVASDLLCQINNAIETKAKNNTALKAQVTQHLQKYGGMLPYWDLKLKKGLQKVEESNAEDEGPKVFSFSRDRKPRAQKVAETPVQVEEKKAPVAEKVLEGFPTGTIVISDETDVRKVVNGADGFDVRIHNMVTSNLTFAFKPSSVIIKNVLKCNITFPSVKGSLLIFNSKSSEIASLAQQIRIHESEDLVVSASCGAIIIEDCTQIKIRGFKLGDGERMAPSDVKDFNWLVRGSQSPNWSYIQ
uniref:C-CAP/cofactor C-like domain-containing protein n=1 Tax=Rhabditophanes sp. KR3021 TaxID=114890 RepID=A0AC35TIT8_9BILA